jgi:hypothetical protein
MTIWTGGWRRPSRSDVLAAVKRDLSAFPYDLSLALLTVIRRRGIGFCSGMKQGRVPAGYWEDVDSLGVDSAAPHERNLRKNLLIQPWRPWARLARTSVEISNAKSFPRGPK